MTTPVLGTDRATAATPSQGALHPLRIALVVLAVAVLVVAAVAVQRSRAAADDEAAAMARHQALVLSAYAGMQDAVNTWWELPADQRTDALLTGGASLGTDAGGEPSSTVVRTEVLRTSPDVVLRLTTVSDGHRSVLWEKRAQGSTDTCSTSDVSPSAIDCEAWALTPLR